MASRRPTRRRCCTASPARITAVPHSPDRRVLASSSCAGGAIGRDPAHADDGRRHPAELDPQRPSSRAAARCPSSGSRCPRPTAFRAAIRWPLSCFYGALAALVTAPAALDLLERAGVAGAVVIIVAVGSPGSNLGVHYPSDIHRRLRDRLSCGCSRSPPRTACSAARTSAARRRRWPSRPRVDPPRSPSW